MLSDQRIVQFLIAVAQFLTGVCANGLILVVNVLGFIRQRHVAPLDLLLCCLATSRICLHLLMFFVHLMVHAFIKKSAFVEYYIIFLFLTLWGLWLATWLGVFYCTKIATIPHPLFYWIKMRISKLVPWLILGSTLYSSISCGIHEKYVWAFKPDDLVTFFTNNATQNKEMDTVSYSLLILHLTMPSIIFLITVLLLIFSLGRHTQKMRNNAAGTRDPRTCITVKAMLYILSFLILYFSNYMMSFLFFFRKIQFGSFRFMFCTLLSGIYPSIHSIILILGNPKLKQTQRSSFYIVSEVSEKRMDQWSESMCR